MKEWFSIFLWLNGFQYLFKCFVTMLSAVFLTDDDDDVCIFFSMWLFDIELFEFPFDEWKCETTQRQIGVRSAEMKGITSLPQQFSQRKIETNTKYFKTAKNSRIRECEKESGDAPSKQNENSLQRNGMPVFRTKQNQTEKCRENTHNHKTQQFVSLCCCRQKASNKRGR